MAGVKDFFGSDYDDVPNAGHGNGLPNNHALGRTVKRGVKAALPPMLFLLLSWYFGWNAVNGDHGLHATQARKQDLVLAKADLQRAESERVDWEKRVAGLQTSHLDPDTLDERARAMLNMAEPNDIVVPYTKDKRLF